MNNEPLVSVIVVAYNAGNTIFETLDSIKAQTYSQIEVIIADDCSRDDTAAKCGQWLAENKDIFVNSKLIINQENKGVSANVNIGIAASTGCWIKLIGDDVLLPDAIQKDLDCAKRDNSNFIVSQVMSFNDSTKKDLSISPANSYEFPKTNERQFVALLKGKLFAPSPTWFIKREVWEEIGHFDETYRLIDDMPFMFKYLQKGYALSYLPQTTVRYRITNRSLSNSQMKSGKQKQDYFNSCNAYFVNLVVPELKKRKMYAVLIHSKLLNYFYQKKIKSKDTSIIRYFFGAMCALLKKL